MKTQLTTEQKAYNRAKGSFKRRVSSMLENRGVRVVQFQLDHIIASEKSELFYKDLTRDDAIEIMEEKINTYNSLGAIGRVA